MTNIRIEHVGDINFRFPYLEIFYNNSTVPFLEIGIDDDKKLCFKFYASQNDIELSIDDIDTITNSAKSFLIETIKNEDDINNWSENKT